MPKNLDHLSVTTTDGSTFTGEQQAQLARLVWFRFGRNMKSAAEAWRRMLENDCTVEEFSSLVIGDTVLCPFCQSEDVNACDEWSADSESDSIDLTEHICQACGRSFWI